MMDKKAVEHRREQTRLKGSFATSALSAVERAVQAWGDEAQGVIRVEINSLDKLTTTFAVKTQDQGTRFFTVKVSEHR